MSESNPQPGSRPTRVLVVSRISTRNQDPAALSGQQSVCQTYIERVLRGPFVFQQLSSRGSGEILDRQELFDLELIIENKEVDVIVAEDLGRIMRRMRAFDICEMCEDQEIRLIAINDHIDTSRSDWRLAALFASMKHENGNKDTSERIIRQMNYDFLNGGVLQHVPFWIIKPAGCRIDTELFLDDARKALILEAIERYRNGQSLTEVACWLVSLGIEGMNARRLRRLFSSRILAGERIRGQTFVKRKNKDGRRRRHVNKQEKILVRPVPHLAIMNIEAFNALQHLLKVRGEPIAIGRKESALNIGPRKPSAFPARRCVCGVCGRIWYWGGHGQTTHMSCSGEREYACWCTATFDGKDGRDRIGDAVMALAANVDLYAPLLTLTVKEEMAKVGDTVADELKTRESDLAKLAAEADRVTAAIRKAGPLEMLLADASRLQDAMNGLHYEIDRLRRSPRRVVDVPPIETLITMAVDAMRALLSEPATVTPEIDRLIPSIMLFPVQLFGGGKTEIRAIVDVDLAGLLTYGSDATDQIPTLLHRIVVDLFGTPQVAKILPHVMNAKQECPARTLKCIAKEVTHCTATATQRAYKLGLALKENGADDPWVLITDPTHLGGKHKKHLHPKFKFTPLEGFPKFEVYHDALRRQNR